MKRILIVDDEFELTSNLRAILENDGYEVSTASDGKQALDALRESSPDVVLLDVMMPLVSGLDVLRSMRRSTEQQHIPVILMSVVRPVAKQSDYGWQVFLQKPFTLKSLMESLERLTENGAQGVTPGASGSR